MGCGSSKGVIDAVKSKVPDGTGDGPGGPWREGDVKCGSHLKHWDELTGFPIFPHECKSHLKRGLTREIWE